MSIQKYPAMKTTELEWVGRIPDNWQLKPFFFLFKEKKRSNKGMKSDNLLSLSYGVIKNKEINTLDGLLPASFETYQVVESDELIFRLTDLQNDKRSLRSALVTERGIITSAYLAVEPQNINPRYASYLFRSYDLSKVFYSMGGGLRQGLNFADLRRLPILYPTAKEQQKIAQFLDYETAKIDALIDEQKRLIELLKEKRQAVISHAVTKGLNPDAPMKDSGIEWLGEVPEHWMVIPIRRLINEHKQGYYTTDSYVDNGVKLLRITDLDGRGSLSTEKCPKVPEASNLEGYLLQHGDIVFARTGGAGLFGVFEENEKVVFASYLIRFKFNQSLVIAKFLRQFLLSNSFQTQLETQIHGGVNKNVHAEDIKNAVMAAPPINEQTLIAQEVESKEKLFDKLIDTAEQSITFMSERRSALISAAVTGKIDVRDWQPPAGSDTVDSNASVQTERHYG